MLKSQSSLMETKTKFMVMSVVIALIIMPIISAYSTANTGDLSYLLKNVGMYFIICGCSFLPYFLPRENLIDRAFIGGAALAAATIQAWVIYGVSLSLQDSSSTFIALLPLYIFSSLAPLLFSTLWAVFRPRWLYPTQGSSIKYALFGGASTVINYLITILVIYIVSI